MTTADRSEPTRPEDTVVAAQMSEFDLAPQRGLWQDSWRRFRQNRTGIVGLVVVIPVIFLGIFGPMLAPYDYTFIELEHVNEGLSWAHPLGYDEVGRDMLSRILVGWRTAFAVALFTTLISFGIGLTIGSIAAYARGVVDNVLMRMTDMVIIFPNLMLAAAVNALIRSRVDEFALEMYQSTGLELFKNKILFDYMIVMGVLTLVSWPTKARLIRGQILSLREREFIRAEQAMGATGWYIIWRHLVPNASGVMIVAASATMGGAMVLESGLSFLGLGIQPPGASWGRMISENISSWAVHPHLVAVPGLVLATCVFGFNFLGDGINDALNPRLSRR